MVIECTKCGEPHPPEHYHPGHRRCRACLSVARKARYAANREREMARNAEYARANPDKVAKCATNRTERRRRAAAARGPIARQTPEERLASRRAWKERNRKKIRAQERARYAADAARFAAKNRRRHVVRMAARDPEALPLVQALYSDPCSYCGGPGGSVDHVEPVSDGGEHGWENLTSACVSCNSRKHTTPLLRFMAATA